MLNTWPDMDLALRIHRTKDLFMGNDSKTMKDLWKWFRLATGKSISNFIRYRRQVKVVILKAGLRGLDLPTSPVSRVLIARYCEKHTHVNLSSNDMPTILKTHTCSDDFTEFVESSERTTPNIQLGMKEAMPLGPPVNGAQPSGFQNRPSDSLISILAGV